MNDTSSRSHAVFSVILTQRRHDVETGLDTEKVSRISLVDLAGSERANSTGAVGARLKEGAEINRSLSTLGRVIAALADVSTGKKKDTVVPFRDSVLTWLLKDALGGNSRTAIIATISPAEINYEETLSTLRYADSAKRIKTHAVINEDPNARLIRELKEELAHLRAKLSGNPEDGNFDPSLPPEKQYVAIRKPDGTIVKVSKAEIAEQLAASEKLMMEVNQTWEEKLANTRAIQRERESALEALGISVEKGLIGLHSPRLPHLVNLSDDPLLAECLVYNLKPNFVTTVGSMESEANIKLSGANILTEHCRFENTDNVVTLYPCDGALVMVNGLRLSEPKRLRSGFRVILGDFHIFRFNNPTEVKADRLRLRHSAQMSFSSPGYLASSPLGGSAEVSRTNSPTPLRVRSDSPVLFSPFSAERDESEWAMARREAALAMIGPDSNVDMLDDDELDQLLSSLQKHKTLRKGRPESRLTEADDDNESTVSSSQFNGKHDSIATAESLDYDTNLSSWPSLPEGHGPFDKLSGLKIDLEQQLEQQKSEYEEKLAAAKMANVEIEQLRQEKEEMQEMLAKAKREAERLLQEQADEFEARVKDIATVTGYLTEREKKVAKSVVRKWRKYKGPRLAETLLQYAGMLKESQVLSLSLGKKIVYQFAMMTHDPFPVSQYEQSIDLRDDTDDLLLYEKKPALAIKVLDFNANRIYFWSLSKFKDRLRIMRSLRDIVDSPFLDHDSVKDNPFIDQQPPQYALIGITDVPLFSVSQQRSERMKLDVYSPHTFNIVAELDVSVISEPAITGEEQSFDVHLHSIQGFNAFMGSEFHIQADLSKQGLQTNQRTVFVSKLRNLSTGSTLRYDQRFTIDSQVPLQKMGHGVCRALRFEIYAKPKLMLLESLSSWDELRSGYDAMKWEESSSGNHIVNGASVVNGF